MTEFRPVADPEGPPKAACGDAGGRWYARRPVLAACLLFAAAFAIRFTHIDTSSFWQDEIVQLRRTTLTLREAWIYRPRDKMPLDYLIQGVVVGNRPDERQARLHACLLGAGFVVAMAAWGWRAGGAVAGAASALLGFALPISVRFSQESGPYALTMLSEALFLGVLLSPPDDRTRLGRWWIAVTGLLLLCAWSHYLLAIPCGMALVLTVAFHRGALLPRPSTRVSEGDGPRGAFPGRLMAGRRILPVCIALFAVGVAPLLGQSASGISGLRRSMERDDPLPRAFQTAEVPRFLDAFAWGYDAEQSVRFSGVVLIGLMAAGMAGSLGTGRRRLALTCLGTSAGTFGVTLALFSGLDHWIKERHVVGALPPALMLAALGLLAIGEGMARLWGGMRRSAVAGTLTLASILALGQSAWVLTRPVERPDWRAVIERVGREGSDRTVLLASDWHSVGVLGYYLELLGVERDFRGVYYEPEIVRALVEQGRDVWVLGTYQDWWNIPREDIARFLTVSSLLPADLPSVRGIDIRRNRSPAELMDDRQLRPLDELEAEAFPLELGLTGEISPYLGSGWFGEFPWAAPYYRRRLMATEAEVLLPIRQPRDVQIRAGFKRSGRKGGADLSIVLDLNDQPLTESSIPEEGSEFEWTIPASSLQPGVNVLRFRASEPLRIPPTDGGDGATSASVEVEYLSVQLDQARAG